MKIIDIHAVISPGQLSNYLQQKLNPLFQQQRQADISFMIENKEGVVEIFHPELYEGFLFRIAISNTQLQITRSEHYVDDVNSLTLESILNSLFEDLAGQKGVALTLEG